MAKVEFIIGWIEKGAFAVATVSVFGIMLITSIDVVKRYVLGNALGWAYHVSVVLLVWMVFTGLSRTTKEEGHINFGMIYERLKGRIRRATLFLHNIIGIVVFGLIGWQSVGYTVYIIREGYLYAPELPVSAAVSWIAIIFGSFLTCLRLALNLVKAP